jgi:hypothetical protein
MSGQSALVHSTTAASNAEGAAEGVRQDAETLGLLHALLAQGRKGGAPPSQQQHGMQEVAARLQGAHLGPQAQQEQQAPQPWGGRSSQLQALWDSGPSLVADSLPLQQTATAGAGQLQLPGLDQLMQEVQQEAAAAEQPNPAALAQHQYEQPHMWALQAAAAPQPAALPALGHSDLQQRRGPGNSTPGLQSHLYRPPLPALQVSCRQPRAAPAIPTDVLPLLQHVGLRAGRSSHTILYNAADAGERS